MVLGCRFDIYFCDVPIGFWNYSDIVAFLDFHFIRYHFSCCQILCQSISSMLDWSVFLAYRHWNLSTENSSLFRHHFWCSPLLIRPPTKDHPCFRPLLPKSILLIRPVFSLASYIVCNLPIMVPEVWIYIILDQCLTYVSMSTKRSPKMKFSEWASVWVAV
jgi:hypothetical protein